MSSSWLTNGGGCISSWLELGISAMSGELVGGASLAGDSGLL